MRNQIIGIIKEALSHREDFFLKKARHQYRQL
jgi:hypothetical protein